MALGSQARWEYGVAIRSNVAMERQIQIKDVKDCEFIKLPFSDRYVLVKRDKLAEDYWQAVGDANQSGMSFSALQIEQIKEQLDGSPPKKE